MLPNTDDRLFSRNMYLSLSTKTQNKSELCLLAIHKHVIVCYSVWKHKEIFINF